MVFLACVHLKSVDVQNIKFKVQDSYIQLSNIPKSVIGYWAGVIYSVRCDWLESSVAK